MEFASGAYGTFMSTTAMHPGGSTRLEIGGENGTAVSEGGLKRFAFRDERPEDKELLDKLDPTRTKTTGGGTSAADVPLNLHALNIASIYEAWSRDEEAVTCAPEARKAVAIIRAMYESARKKGAPIDVK
jgi:predicted dehydrogenase